jgi:dolichyl-phosphate beta-glucosyltransferase
LSVVLPAYNEAPRIGATLRSLEAYLGTLPHASEIVVVDDGSEDGTAAAVREAAKSLVIPVRLVRYRENRGKGHALRTGFAITGGERILFMDVDLSTAPAEADKLLRELDGGCDVVLGSRKMRGAEVDVHQPWWRETMGKAFTILCRFVISDVSDLTCGFKAFRGEAGRDIFARTRISDWSFDAEVLMIARRLGYAVGEVPVRWRDMPGTKVRPLGAAFFALVGLARIRYYAWSGAYAVRTPVTSAQETWSSMSRAAGAGAEAVARD